MLGGQAMEAAGYQTADQIRNEKIMEIRQQFPNPTTDADFRQIGNAFNNIGETEYAEKAFDQIKAGSGSDTRGSLQKNVEFMATLNKCYNFEVGTDEYDTCMNKSFIDVQEYKRPGQEEEGLIGGVKSFQDTIATVRDSQKNLRKNLSTLTSLKSLVPQIYTGTGQSVVAAWNKVGTILGFEDAANAQAATEAFRSGGLEVAMNYIHDTKGAVSDMEMEKFIEASPNLHNTKLGNLFIIEFAIARQKREQKLLSAMNKFSLKHSGATSTQWNIEEDRLLNSEEYDISKKLQAAYDAARNDPKYTGLTTDVVSEGDASTDMQSRIDALPPLQ